MKTITLEVSAIDDIIRHLNYVIDVCETTRKGEIANTNKIKDLMELKDHPMMKASACTQLSLEKLVKYFEEIKN